MDLSSLAVALPFPAEPSPAAGENLHPQLPLELLRLILDDTITQLFADFGWQSAAELLLLHSALLSSSRRPLYQSIWLGGPDSDRLLFRTLEGNESLAGFVATINVGVETEMYGSQSRPRLQAALRICQNVVEVREWRDYEAPSYGISQAFAAERKPQRITRLRLVAFPGKAARVSPLENPIGRLTSLKHLELVDIDLGALGGHLPSQPTFQLVSLSLASCYPDLPIALNFLLSHSLHTLRHLVVPLTFPLPDGVQFSSLTTFDVIHGTPRLNKSMLQDLFAFLAALPSLLHFGLQMSEGNVYFIAEALHSVKFLSHLPFNLHAINIPQLHISPSTLNSGRYSFLRQLQVRRPKSEEEGLQLAMVCARQGISLVCARQGISLITVEEAVWGQEVVATLPPWRRGRRREVDAAGKEGEN